MSDNYSQQASEQLLRQSDYRDSASEAIPQPDPSAYKQPPVFYSPITKKSSKTLPNQSGGCSAVCTRYAVLLCCGLTVLAFGCHIAGFSTQGWAYHDIHIYKFKFGLFRYTQCWDYAFLGGSLTCFDDYMVETKTGNGTFCLVFIYFI